MPLDQVTLNFNPASLLALNIILGVVMFGIALDLRLADFRTLIRVPRSAFIGLSCQFVLLPLFSFGLIHLLKPTPSMALGMLLVASCPGGNISNFFTYIARGNTALSICLSAISTLMAVIFTPLNFSFWGSLYAPSASLMSAVSVDPLDLVMTILLILGLPLTAGLLVAHRLPEFARRARKPMKYFSMAVFLAFVAGALIANWQHFLNYVGIVALAVFVHNGVALLLGYWSSAAMKLPLADRRAVSIEVGIQNSGLALLLIFSFFEGLGGMAIIAAWWGIWHIISGFSLALFWSKR